MKPYHGLDNLRLELQAPPAGLPNLVLNPSGAKGAWFWITPAAGNVMTSSGTALTLKATVSQPSACFTDYMPVAAGKYVSVRLDLVALTASHNVKFRLDWYTAAKTFIGSAVESAGVSALGTAFPLLTWQAPANTAYAKLRIGLYNGTGNPSVNALVTFNRAMVTWGDTDVMGPVRTNLIPNPSFELDTAGWRGLEGTTIARTTTVAAQGTASLEVTRATAGDLVVSTLEGTGGIPVTPGNDYVLRWDMRAAITGRDTIAEVRWYDTNGDLLFPIEGMGGGSDATGTWTTGAAGESGQWEAPADAAYAALSVRWEGVGAGEVHYLDGVLFEAASFATSYFDGANTDTSVHEYRWTGAPHASTSLDVSDIGSFPYAEPATWRNILGPTFELRIGRAALDVGTLTASISDPLMDPAVTADVRPGKAVRLVALVAGAWTNVYEGRIVNAVVDYDRTKEPGAADTTIITLTAVDAIATLAKTGESRGYETINALPYILEGKGVPWNVNGSGNHYQGTPVQISANPAAAVLDQVAVTRDTAKGYAWVDRNNILQVWDGANIPATIAATFTDVASADPAYDGYSSIDVDYDTTRCINEVTVKWLRYDAAQGTSEEIAYGPYRDQTSIDTWGTYAAEFTIHGATESSASIGAYAAAILAANATPARRCNSLVMPVVDARSHTHAAALDLYDKVHVTYSDKVNADYRITALEHQITPKKWIVGYSFEVVGSVAAPQLVPAPPATPGGLPWRDVYRSAAQPVATSTFTKVLWDTNRTTAISMAYTSGTFTADRAGIYEVRGVITFASSATGSRIARILAAGTEVYRNTLGTNPSSLASVPFSDSVRLAAGDTLEIEAWQNSGGSLDVIGSAAGSKATITYLRA